MASTNGHWTLFAEWSQTLADLNAAGALLSWDRETAMPRGGATARAAQTGTLSAIHHRELVREDVGEAIAALQSAPDPDDEAQAMVWWARRERDRAVRVPEALVRELSEACSRSVSVWSDARPRDDVAAYVAALRPVVELTRRYAEAVSTDGELYDALLDEYEPGARAAELEPLLDKLAEEIRPLVGPATEASPLPLPSARWPAGAQLALASDLAVVVGFDFDHGAIAKSAHPFTTSIGAGDVRFTTRVDEADPVSNIRAVLHEAGHALYEQGFPARFAGTWLHDAPSLGAHESQSLFWENHVGRTDGFWSFLEPDLRRHFPDAMKSVGIERLASTSRRVEPSLIRVEADEVTYNLHIVLRFQLELALMRDDLAVEDLPSAFAEGMERLLGLRPPRAADGVMQDVHWPHGFIGYFPTYTLGHLYAAQLATSAEAELGPMSELSGSGSFDAILGFLRERVHAFGRQRSTKDLLREATGAELDSAPFIAHLVRQYVPD